MPDLATIEERRKAANITVAKLCREAPVARSTYDRWLREATGPNLATLRRVAEALDRLDIQTPDTDQAA